MHIITARTSNIRRLEDHQIIFGLVSFDTNQGQIHVEVTVQPETEAELAMPQAAMIKRPNANCAGSINFQPRS